MKTLAWLFGIFVCASSAYGQKTVTIEGDIRNMPDTVRFFCAEMTGNGMDVRPEDQEKMVNGKFKFTREADRTTKMYISLNNTGYTVWVKPGANIKITGEAPYVQNWLAESDIPIPEQVELNRFREATREENIRIHDLTAECMKLLPKIRAKDSVAKQKFASIRQTVNSIHDEIILQKELLLMLDYPITDAGLEELRDAAKSCQAGKLKDKALVVSVYSKLTDEQRQSRLGEEITSLLSISSTVQEGDKIADVELKDIKGNIHHLSDYKGKYIILDFWSQYCGPCLDAFPLLKEIAEKYKEKSDICNAIGAHHDETEMTSLLAPIVQVCDAISGARPGARREIVEAYIKRLNDLEQLALSYPGVLKTYAIQAGRELRVIVGADKIDDTETENLSTEIAKRIQDEMTYPGQVKITVIRETRAVSFAK